MRLGDVLVSAMVLCSLQQPAGKFSGLCQIFLSQPMTRGCRFQANHIAPAKPCITFEDLSRFRKRCDRLLALARKRVIDAEINMRVGLSFQNMILPRDFPSLAIVFQCTVEVL